jgi:hypothetical protein
MPELSPAYTEAREALLAASPETSQVEVPEAPSQVYGVIVDIGFNPLFTVGVFADGTTSAYDGNGGAVTGLGEMIATLVLGRGVLQAVEANTASFRPVESTPVPAFGRVRFTVLTRDGRLGVEADGAALLKGGHPLSTAFNAVMGIMEQARHRAAASDAPPVN